MQFVGLAGLAMSIVACSDAPEESVNSTDGVEKETVVRIAHYAFPPGLANPYKSVSPPASFFWSALYDGLTEVDGEGVVRPALAQSWRNLDDHTWIFELRPGVAFSNGERLSAETVARTVEVLKGNAADGWLLSPEARQIRSVRAVDELTVELRTKEPMPYLPRFLSLMKIVPPEYWDRLGSDGFALHPVGTGPFRLVGEWSGQRLEFEAFVGSWRPPKADRLTMIEMPDASAREQSLLAGDVDIALAVGPDLRAKVEAAGGTLKVRPGTGVLVLAFVLTGQSPLRDIRVRQALNFAVDKAAIVDTLLAGATRASGQGVRSTVPGYDAAIRPFPYDPEKARRLLAEAGYADRLTLAADIAIGGSANDIAVMQQVGAYLEAVGVRVDMRAIPISQLVQRVFQGGWDSAMFLMDYNATTALDPMRPLRLHSCTWPAPWYCNDEMTPLIGAAAVEMDDATRDALIARIYRAYHDDASALYLYETVGFDAVGPGVADYRAPNGVIDYAALTKRSRGGKSDPP